MKRAKGCVLVVACAVLGAACNLAGAPATPTRAVDANTPEGAVLAYVAASAPNPDAATASFGAIHIWELGSDRLVAYSYAGGYEEAWSLCNGQARVTPAGGGWQMVEAGERCWDKASAVVLTGLYSVVADAAGNTQTVIYGEVLVPDITAVSLEFVVGGANAVAEFGAGGYWLMVPGEQPPVRAVAVNALGNLVKMFAFGEPLAMTPAASAP